MAANNMVNILRGHVEHQQRPLYLHPVDKNGHHPWLARGGNDTVLPEDPSQASSSSSRAGHKRKTTDGDTDRSPKRTKGTMVKEKATTPQGRTTTPKGRTITPKGRTTTTRGRTMTTEGQAEATKGRKGNTKARAATSKGKTVHVNDC